MPVQTRPGKMAIIATASFIMSIAVGITALGLLFIVKDVYRAKATLVGSLGAFWSLAYFVGCLVLRKPGERLRPTTAMAISLAGGAVLLGAFLAFPSLGSAFACYLAYGFLVAFFWPPVMGWMSRGLEGAELNRATSLFSFSWSIGGVLSSYIAGLLSARGKFLPIVVAMVLLALNAALVLASRLFVSDTARDDDGAAAVPGSLGAEAYADPETDHSTPLRYPAWVGVFLIYMAIGVVTNVFPVFARDGLAMSEPAIGLALTIRSLATTVGFMVLGRFTFGQGKRSALILVTLASALTVAVMAVQRSPAGFMLCFMVIGLLQAFMYNSALFYATSGALDRGKRVSAHESVLTVGSIVGSLSGGAVLEAFSMQAVFAGLGLALATGCVAQAAMARRLGPGVRA